MDNLANPVLDDNRFVRLDSEAPLASEHSVLQLLVPLVASLLSSGIVHRRLCTGRLTSKVKWVTKFCISGGIRFGNEVLTGIAPRCRALTPGAREDSLLGGAHSNDAGVVQIHKLKLLTSIDSTREAQHTASSFVL